MTKKELYMLICLFDATFKSMSLKTFQVWLSTLLPWLLEMKNLCKMSTSRNYVKTDFVIRCLLYSIFICRYINARFKDVSTICANTEEKYPPKLRNLFREELKKEDDSKISRIAKTLKIKTSPEQCEALEKDTRQQAKSKLCFRYRAGKKMCLLWHYYFSVYVIV